MLGTIIHIVLSYLTTSLCVQYASEHELEHLGLGIGSNGREGCPTSLFSSNDSYDSCVMSHVIYCGKQIILFDGAWWDSTCWSCEFGAVAGPYTMPYVFSAPTPKLKVASPGRLGGRLILYRQPPMA